MYDYKSLKTRRKSMTTPKQERASIEKVERLAILNDPINPDLYKKYDVKRGLRNANGTGV